MRSSNARQFSGPGAGERDHAEYLSTLDGMVYGEDPSEGFARGRHFLHPKLGFTFIAPPGFTLDNTAQAVLGLKDGGGEALRLDVVSVPAEQSLPDYLRVGMDGKCRSHKCRGIFRERISGGNGDRRRRKLVVPYICRAFRQRCLSLYLCRQGENRAGRSRLSGIDHEFSAA